MTEQVNILSARDYMQKYGAKGIGEGADRWMIKRQMLDRFRKEIFELAIFRIGPEVFSNEYEPTKKEREKLMNILVNAQKKWNTVCKMFEMYKETSGLIEPKDLQKHLEESLKLGEMIDSYAEANDIPEEEIPFTDD